MLCRAKYVTRSVRRLFTDHHLKAFSGARSTRIAPVSQLADWNLQTFKDNAYNPGCPVSLPFRQSALPPACKKWFVHDADVDHQLQTQPEVSELRTAFWSEHEMSMVPLELTSTSDDKESSFNRSLAPLKILLTHIGNSLTSSSSSSSTQASHSIYLAQCDIDSLPESLQSDLPTPELVKHAGKGDIYSSSLWMGRPPTYTPLHRDPNPNLFLQLAGRKTIRLFPPEIGNAIFDQVQQTLARQKQGRTNTSASFRGEEMMHGPEKRLLHDIVWGDEDGHGDSDYDQNLLTYAVEANVGAGEGLFIPKGWWHSVKGVGKGVTASANWWFR